MSHELTKEKLQKYHRKPKTEFTVYLPNICSSLFLWFCLEKQLANLKTTEFLISFVVRSGDFWPMKQEVQIGWAFLRKFVFLFPLPCLECREGRVPTCQKVMYQEWRLRRARQKENWGLGQAWLPLVTGESGVSFWACGNQRRHLWGLENWAGT